MKFVANSNVEQGQGGVDGPSYAGHQRRDQIKVWWGLFCVLLRTGHVLMCHLHRFVKEHTISSYSFTFSLWLQTQEPLIFWLLYSTLCSVTNAWGTLRGRFCRGSVTSWCLWTVYHSRRGSASVYMVPDVSSSYGGLFFSLWFIMRFYVGPFKCQCFSPSSP